LAEGRREVRLRNTPPNFQALATPASSIESQETQRLDDKFRTEEADIPELISFARNTPHKKSKQPQTRKDHPLPHETINTMPPIKVPAVKTKQTTPVMTMPLPSDLNASSQNYLSKIELKTRYS